MPEVTPPAPKPRKRPQFPEFVYVAWDEDRQDWRLVPLDMMAPYAVGQYGFKSSAPARRSAKAAPAAPGDSAAGL